MAYFTKEESGEGFFNIGADTPELWITNIQLRPVRTEWYPRSVVLKPGEQPPVWARDLLYYNPSTIEQEVELGAFEWAA